MRGVTLDCFFLLLALSTTGEGSSMHYQSCNASRQSVTCFYSAEAVFELFDGVAVYNWKLGVRERVAVCTHNTAEHCQTPNGIPPPTFANSTLTVQLPQGASGIYECTTVPPDPVFFAVPCAVEDLSNKTTAGSKNYNGEHNQQNNIPILQYIVIGILVFLLIVAVVIWVGTIVRKRRHRHEESLDGRIQVRNDDEQDLSQVNESASLA